MAEEGDQLVMILRLVGDVSRTVYAEGAVSARSLYKDPDFYLGYLYLATPFTPYDPSDPEDELKRRPALDAEDTAVVLEAIAHSADTVFNGHWLGTIERRPKALVELPEESIIK